MEPLSKEVSRLLSFPNDKEVKHTDKILEESRKEMYTALGLFHNHVKYVIYIMVSMPAAILVVMRLWKTDPPPLVPLIAGAILILVLPVSLFSIRIIQRYYEVYVSALIFATRVHIAAGYTEGHPWLEHTIQQIEKIVEEARNKRKTVKDCVKLVEIRAKRKKDSFRDYKNIITTLAIACCSFGILLVWMAVCGMCSYLAKVLVSYWQLWREIFF